LQSALTRLEFPEIFIGLVAPVGVDIKPSIDAFSHFFKQNDYDVVTIKVTDRFPAIKAELNIDIALHEHPTDKRIGSYIDFGNKVRQTFSDNSILAAYTIFRILQKRERDFRRKKEISYEKRFFILHQFKRTEEIDLLRTVYGKSFFQVSIYSQKESRISHLSYKLAHEKNTADQTNTKTAAHELIARDENEKSNTHGQRVTKIFHDADFIINSDIVDRNSIDYQVGRFCELLFSSNEVSPTKQEYGMFAAKAAALRTLDLSRQVGAAIFRNTGEMISLGSNEVPKAGGGTYWCDELPFDAREYTRGEDSNDVRKKEILHEIFLATGSLLPFEQFLKQKDVQDSQFMDALEYGRIVHAEMSAISDASRLGLATSGAVLFSTTFPCHMCAKHIVASGIQTVIFLEPYPKSLASDLHPDALWIEGGSRGKYQPYPSVEFEHFHGITPRRYRELFERSSRKKDGKYAKYISDVKRPNINIIEPFYTILEKRVVEEGIAAYSRIKSECSRKADPDVLTTAPAP
jgi:deoxycytidylate deaminase